MKRHVLAVALAVLGLSVFAAPVPAQPYPSRTVTIIVPYPPGGPTDQLARVVVNPLSATLGHTFIGENVSGGGTAVATGRPARAAPGRPTPPPPHLPSFATGPPSKHPSVDPGQP